MRKLKFRCAMAINFVKMSPVTAFEAMFPCIHYTEMRKGVLLLDVNRNTLAAFVREIDGALDLIALNSPLLFRRVTREIRRIYHIPCHTGAEYTWPLKICTMQLSKLLPPTVSDENEKSAHLACILIHEATHGHLFRRGIYHDHPKANYQRVEEICCRQMNVFARRIGIPEYPIGEFNPSSFSERLKVFKVDLRKYIDDE